MKCNEYSQYSVLCQGCNYPKDIKCCKKVMVCEICNEVVEPLDAHTGRLKDKLITAHIDCWNKEIKNQ